MFRVERSCDGSGYREADRRRRPREGGQGLVEFALCLPIFVFLLMGMVEFGFLYNNILTVQFAARQGVSAAAAVGARRRRRLHDPQGDRVRAHGPDRQDQITFVDIFQSDSNGDPVSGKVNHYTRTRHPRLPGHARTSRTRSSGGEGYPQTDRKDSLAAGLDIVGVQIGYLYNAITPIGSGRSWSAVGRRDAAHGAQAVSASRRGLPARPAAIRPRARASRSSSSP